MVVEDHPAELILEARRRAKRCAILHGPQDAVLHHGVSVSEDERAPRAAEVDVALPVSVPDVGALPPVDKERGAPDGPKGADGRIHATGEAALGFLEQFGTAGSGVGGLGHGVAFGAKLAPMAAGTLPLSAENRDLHAPCHDELVRSQCLPR